MTQNTTASTVQRSWLVKDHLMLITMPEILTTTELQANDVEILSVLETSSSSFIHFLTDTRPLRVYPSLGDYLGLKALKHPHIGWSMSVGAIKQPLLHFFLTTIMSSARVRYRDFELMPDAIKFARTIDNALANVSLES